MKTRPNDLINLAHPNEHQYEGLTKREYFAAMAMQGIVSESSKIDDKLCPDNLTHDKWVSKMAIAIADALIGEINNEN